MWRVIVGSLTAVLLMAGQAWAIPTDVSFAGVLTCPGGCQDGSTLTASRSVPGDTGNPEGASFQDHYSFALSGPVDLNGTGFALDFIPGFNVENLTFELFDPSLSSLGSFSVPNGSDGAFFVPLSYASLATGAYTLLVSGIIPAAFEGGAYLLQGQFTATVSQVPLPPAMLLFLSALMGMFSLAQMRKRTPSA